VDGVGSHGRRAAHRAQRGPDDLTFRIGGEEFLVVLPATSGERALVVLEHVRLAWRAQRPVPMTFSAGVKTGGRDRFQLAGG